MKADAHRQAAEELEVVMPDLLNSAVGLRANRLLIEAYWGAAFHWIAFGCQQKHGKHKEKHEGLFKFLNDIGESQIADNWRSIDDARRGGFYGHHISDTDRQTAHRLWQEIRTWALS